MYKKAWCTCKVVVLLIEPIVFLRFSLPSASSLMSSLHAGASEKRENEGGTLAVY